MSRGLFPGNVNIVGPSGVGQTVSMLVDAGASYSTIPSGLVRELGLVQNREKLLDFTNGRERCVRVEARIQCEEREAPTLAVLLDGPARPGQYALDGLDGARKRLVAALGFVWDLPTDD